MKVKELCDRLKTFDEADEVVVSISAHKDYNAKDSYTSINNLYRGFQKVEGKVLLVTANSLTKTVIPGKEEQ